MRAGDLNIVFTGYVDEKGQLHLHQRHDFARHVTRYTGRDVEVVVRLPKKHRSGKQNRYYHKVVCGLIAEASGYSPEEAHEALKHKFLADGDGPLVKVRSTADLSTAEFEDYIERIKAFASEFYELYIPDPNEADFVDDELSAIDTQLDG